MFINKKAYLLQMKVLCILTISFCLSACISRLSRPEMIGQVIDESGHPITNVQVGENQTDANGQFKLKEHRYYAFLVTEILGMEAPAVFVREAVIKRDFQTCYLRYFSRYGGGQGKGAKWEIGKVVLYTDADVKKLGELPDCDMKYREK